MMSEFLGFMVLRTGDTLQCSLFCSILRRLNQGEDSRVLV